MNDINNLQIDSMKMDTSLTEIYLKSNQEFHSTKCCIKEVEENVIDSCNNIIFCINNYEACEPDEAMTGCQSLRMLRILANKLRDNDDLFAQLDFKIRQRSIDEGRIHIDLIIKQFLYWSLIMEDNDINLESVMINMNDGDDLLKLGLVASALVHYKTVVIYASKQTAAICHLFTNICHKVGLCNIHLRLMEELKQKDDYDVSSRGCAGVITDCSDVESAVDVFLSSTTMSPWSLKKLFIQESVYAEFKLIIKWKCNIDNSNDESQTERYEGGSKIFILDNFNADDTTRGYVYVEAYRTTNELLSLMTEFRPDYLSLWSSTHSDVNEIAHAVQCNIVWINDFGAFQNPFEISNSVYQSTFDKQYQNISIPTSLVQCGKQWENYNIQERKQILLDSLENYLLADEIDRMDSVFINMVRSNVKICSSGSVDVSKGTMCLGVYRPVGVIYVTCNNSLLKALVSLSYGNTVVINDTVYQSRKKLLDMLIKSGLPIHGLNKDMSESNLIHCKGYNTAHSTITKFICSNFGTIFAN